MELILKNLSLMFFCLTLTACSSVPLGTMLKMASMDKNDILQIKPREVRVRITLDEPAELEEKEVTLSFKFEHKQGKKSEYQYKLKLLSQRAIKAEAGFFSDTSAANQYEFRISEQSIEEFKQYQIEFAQAGKPESYAWRVYYYLKNIIKSELSLTLDVELKLSNEQSYFYLFKNAKLAVES